MDSRQVFAKDLPSEAAKESRKLFGVAEWMVNCSQYGPKKYYMKDISFKPVSEIIPQMKLRCDDIWIGGFPRSGTHWLAEMTWLINKNLDFDTARNVNHQDRVTFFPRRHEDFTISKENGMRPPIMESYDKIPSTRIFKTHVPLSLLPPKLLETSKMIYVARDPRDMLVSNYHFSCDWDLTKFQGTIEDLFELFIQDNCKHMYFFLLVKSIFSQMSAIQTSQMKNLLNWIRVERVPYCPYFENVLEFWNARHNRNLLFLFYEEIVKDLPSVVRRISKFFDKEFTESQYEQLSEYLQFSNLKNSKTFRSRKFKNNDLLIRKGKIGSWQEEFTEGMKKRIEIWMRDKLKATDLSFPTLQF